MARRGGEDGTRASHTRRHAAGEEAARRGESGDMAGTANHPLKHGGGGSNEGREEDEQLTDRVNGEWNEPTGHALGRANDLLGSMAGRRRRRGKCPGLPQRMTRCKEAVTLRQRKRDGDAIGRLPQPTRCIGARG